MRAVRPIVRAAAPRATLPGLLQQVLVPGGLRGRAMAAAALPTWLAGALALVSIVLAVEVIGYISVVAHDFLEVMFARWETTARIPTGAAAVFLEVAIQHIRPHVIPAMLGGPTGLVTGLSGVVYLGILLESMNLVLLAPLVAGNGQKIARVLRKTRKVLLALGGVWLLEWSVLWLVLFLAASALVLRIIEVMYIRISYTVLDDLTTLSLEVCLAALLVAWVTQLTKAAGCLAPSPDEALAPRCGVCGYLLTGVPQDSPCRECGQEAPAGLDRQRSDNPWLDGRTRGRYRVLGATSAAILCCPARFFAGVRMLTDVRQALQFVRWNLGLSIAAWGMAVPGIAAALTEPDDIYIAGHAASAVLIALLIGLTSALAGALSIGLIISLLGFAISRVREEPAWPIAATSGCYLSAVLPRVAIVQALWVTALFTAEQASQRGLWLHLARQWWTQTGIAWEVLLSLIFAAPTLVGMILLARTAMVCYRGVRFACQ